MLKEKYRYKFRYTGIKSGFLRLHGDAEPTWTLIREKPFEVLATQDTPRAARRHLLVALSDFKQQI